MRRTSTSSPGGAPRGPPGAAPSPGGAAYFDASSRKGEVNELRALMKNLNVEKDPKRKRDIIKKVRPRVFLSLSLSLPLHHLPLAHTPARPGHRIHDPRHRRVSPVQRDGNGGGDARPRSEEDGVPLPVQLRPGDARPGVDVRAPLLPPPTHTHTQPLTSSTAGASTRCSATAKTKTQW